MTVSAEVSSAPVEVLAAGGDRVVVAARNGNLYISGEKLAVKHVCGAAVGIADRVLVAAITLDKELIVLAKHTESGTWKEIAKHLLPKRPTAASFSVTTAEVVVADAFGDVYKLPITGSVSLRGDCDQGSALLLGHFSTVTTLALKGSMIATADRDNKLRVSRFPDSFVVQSFCLAHEEFITCVRWIGSDRLISGAGDGTIRLWNAADGQLLETVQLREHVSDKPSDSNAVKVSPVVTCVEVYPDNPDIAVIAVYRANYVLVATGLLSSRLRIHCAFRFEEGNCITGIGFDEKCHLWVSLSSDSNSVRVYSLRGLETSEPRFELKGTMQVEHDDQTQSEETSLEKGATSLSVMRFDWLNQQRKREMVEDWKGKKRKHIEI